MAYLDCLLEKQSKAWEVLMSRYDCFLPRSYSGRGPRAAPKTTFRITPLDRVPCFISQTHLFPPLVHTIRKEAPLSTTFYRMTESRL